MEETNEAAAEQDWSGLAPAALANYIASLGGDAYQTYAKNILENELFGAYLLDRVGTKEFEETLAKVGVLKVNTYESAHIITKNEHVSQPQLFTQMSHFFFIFLQEWHVDLIRRKFIERKKEKNKTDDDDDVAASLVTDASGKRHFSSNESSQRSAENALYAYGETGKRGRDQQNHHVSDKRRRTSGSGDQDDEGSVGLEVLAAAASSVRKTSSSGKKTLQSRSGGKIPVPIEQYDITTGKTIAEYDSQRAAERATNVDNGSISECVRGIAVSAGGFGWREAGTEGQIVPAGMASGGSFTSSKKPSSSANNQSNRRLGKTAVSVQQFDLTTGLTIENFDSQRSAARALGIDRNDICDCIQGKLPHAGFFGWRKVTIGLLGDPPANYSLIYTPAWPTPLFPSYHAHNIVTSIFQPIPLF